MHEIKFLNITVIIGENNLGDSSCMHILHISKPLNLYYYKNFSV